MLNAGWGGVLVAPRMSLLHTYLDIGSVATDREGTRRAWPDPGSTHAWPFSFSQLARGVSH